MAEANNASQHGEAKRPKKPSFWRWLKIAAIAVVAILIVLWAAHWLYHRMTHVSSKDAQVATHEITISSRMAGRVTGFDLIQGDQIKKGQPIAQLYSRPAKLKLQEIKAKVARMRAQINAQKTRIALAKTQLTGGVAQTKSMLTTDRAAASAAKADMEKARNKARRAEKLYKAHGVSQQQRDVDRYNYQAAKASYTRAQRQVAVDRIALANAKTGMLTGPQMSVGNPHVLQKQLSVMQSQLNEAKASLAHQQNQIADLTVKSPINGVVDKTFIQQDEYVSPGQPILMMHDPDNVWIRTKMKETKIAALRLGQPVSIHVDARPNSDYRGRVQVIGHAATDQFALLPNPNPSGNFTKVTQRIPVRISIDHGPLTQLAPGMMVEVGVDTTSKGWAHPQNHPVPTRYTERRSSSDTAHISKITAAHKTPRTQSDPQHRRPQPDKVTSGVDAAPAPAIAGPPASSKRLSFANALPLSHAR